MSWPSSLCHRPLKGSRNERTKTLHCAEGPLLKRICTTLHNTLRLRRRSDRKALLLYSRGRANCQLHLMLSLSSFTTGVGSCSHRHHTDKSTAVLRVSLRDVLGRLLPRPSSSLFSPSMSLLNLPIHLQLLIFAFLYPNVSYAKAGLMNFTIDDNDPAILYSPGWNVSASQDPLDYGGLHHLSDQSSAFAVFNFTGTKFHMRNFDS